jgi:hypothetical protein
MTATPTKFTNDGRPIYQVTVPTITAAHQHGDLSHHQTKGNSKMSIDTIISAIQTLNAADKTALVAKLQDVSATESKVAVQKNRIAAVRAAANDPKKAHAFKGALRGLSRLNVALEDLCASATPLADLNKALDSASLGFSERITIKTCLHECGVID